VATIEQALAAAYRKDYGQKNQNIKVEFDPETAKSKIFDVKTVVEDMPEEEETEDGDETEVKEKKNNSEDEKKSKVSAQGGSASGGKSHLPADKAGKSKVTEENSKKEKDKDEVDETSTEEEEERKFNPRTDIQISDAKLLKKIAKIGDEIKTKLEAPADYGRMAAQTAKQVIIQRLREAEREMVFSEFKDKEGEVISGVVQRREGRFVLVDIGKTVGYLPNEEQIFGEKYNPGERVKVYIKEVRAGSKGAEVVLSRTSDEILKKIFYLEIPEISNGLVELKGVAREAGSRSKVAVWTDSDNVDPIGSCVGQRGARIQTIISELGGEKVDIVIWDENPVKFIANALSPAKILEIKVDDKNKNATVKVSEDQLSLAIGKSGQNARLAARLTGWRIDIVGDKAKDGLENKEDEEGKRGEEEDKIKKTESSKHPPAGRAGKTEEDKGKKKKSEKEKEYSDKKRADKKEKKINAKKESEKKSTGKTKKETKKKVKDDKEKNEKKEK